MAAYTHMLDRIQKGDEKAARAYISSVKAIAAKIEQFEYRFVTREEHAAAMLRIEQLMNNSISAQATTHRRIDELLFQLSARHNRV